MEVLPLAALLPSQLGACQKTKECQMPVRCGPLLQLLLCRLSSATARPQPPQLQSHRQQCPKAPALWQKWGLLSPILLRLKRWWQHQRRQSKRCPRLDPCLMVAAGRQVAVLCRPTAPGSPACRS